MKRANLLRLRWLIPIIIIMDGTSSLLGRQALHSQNEGKEKSVLWGAIKCDQSPSTAAVAAGAAASGFIIIAHLAATFAGGWRAYGECISKCNFCGFLTLVLFYLAMVALTYVGTHLLWSGVQYNISLFKEKDHTKCSTLFSPDRFVQGWGEWASLLHLVVSLLYCLICYVSVHGICGCCDCCFEGGKNEKKDRGPSNKV